MILLLIVWMLIYKRRTLCEISERNGQASHDPGIAHSLMLAYKSNIFEHRICKRGR